MRQLRFRSEDHIGEKFRPCYLCGTDWSETDTDTAETNYFGRLYPESLLIERNGRWFCTNHYTWRFRHKDINEEPFDMPDEDREGPPKGTVDA